MTFNSIVLIIWITMLYRTKNVNGIVELPTFPGFHYPRRLIMEVSHVSYRIIKIPNISYLLFSLYSLYFSILFSVFLTIQTKKSLKEFSKSFLLVFFLIINH